jgi:hypothetical protein
LKINPADFEIFTGLKVPDPITFVVDKQWLDRPQLYPRQATIIKLVFLRLDLLTPYDHGVIDGWEEAFRRTGDNGIVPGVRDRAAYLRDHGYAYFREVLLVLGRRAGKGYVSALCMAYVLYSAYLAKGDPQSYYGLAKDKQLGCFIYAGKKEQAKANLWADLNNVVISAPCFERFISRPLAESLSLYAPADFQRLARLKKRGITTQKDQASFTIQPKEATAMSGRGPALAILGFDEEGHVVATGATRSAEEVMNAAQPALDQFRKAAFIIEPSSPWTQIGSFYEAWCHALELNEDEHPEYPTIFMLQLESWDVYQDWQTAHHLPLLPAGFTGDLGEYVDAPLPGLQRLQGAIQEYDEEMARQEKANPENFAVERRAKWATVLDAYLNPDKVDAMFDPELSMTTSGPLSIFYKGHADPSLANANFAVGIGHPVTSEDGLVHCVLDFMHHWRPQDFPDHTIDYMEIEERLWELIKSFHCNEFTFDQFQSQSYIQRLQYKIRKAKMPKRMTVYEQTATLAHNWERAENFKVALNQGWIRCPEYDQLRQELKFLQLVTTQTGTNRVEKQDTGPVITKDTADVAFEIVWTILGDQVRSYTHGALSTSSLAALVPGGFSPYDKLAPEASNQDLDVFRRLSGRERQARMRGGAFSPARNSAAFRNRRR